MSKSVVVRRLNAPGLKSNYRRRWALAHNLHLAARHDPDGFKSDAFPQAADGTGGGDVGDGGHLFWGVIEEVLDIIRPIGVTGGRAGSFEGGFEPGSKNLEGVLGGGGNAGDGEDVAGVDGSGVGGIALGEAGGGIDPGELVGEDGNADSSAAGDDAAGLGGRATRSGGSAHEAAYLLGDRIVLVGAEVDDFYTGKGAKVFDEGILQGATERIGAGVDLEGGRAGGAGAVLR